MSDLPSGLFRLPAYMVFTNHWVWGLCVLAVIVGVPAAADRFLS